MSKADHAEFWATIRAASERVERDLNLRGKTTAKCVKCNGSGETEPSRIDYDAHGSYWVAPVPCRYCHGGRVEVACSAEVEAAAIRVEVKRHQARLRELRAQVRKAGSDG